MYRFLLQIFPNIKRVVAPKKLTPWGASVEDEGTSWLNSQINLQRGLKSIRARIADEYGEKAASLIPASFPTDVYDD